jgi:hypothetical protein
LTRSEADQAFLDALSAGTLGASEFNHRAHLRLAWLCLTELGWPAGADRCARTIRDYANAVGATRKYHETVTRAVLMLVRDRMRRQPGSAFGDFLDANMDLERDALGLLLAHYSRDRLFSEKACRTFLPPDLAPLPGDPG